MRLTSLVSVAIYLAVVALLIISFAKSWYHYDERGLASDSQPFVPFYNFYYDHLNIQNSLLASENGNHKYTDYYLYEFMTLNFKSIAQAAFAFSVLAWIVAIVQVALSVADVLEFKLPPIGKFLGFVVFLFSLLSFLIFLGFPAKMRQDCIKAHGEVYCDETISHGYYHKSFIGKSEDDIGRWGPSAGWNCVVISCAISLAGSVYNVLFFAKGA